MNVPLHVTEDRLLGGQDAEYALQRGERRLSPGLLAEADGQALVIDEANLLPERMMRLIMRAAESGYCEIEREGLSERRLSRFLLFGTMNPEEGNAAGTLIDGFGLYVRIEAERNAAARMEIIRRRLAFERDQHAFAHSFEDSAAALREWIGEAIRRLPFVQADEAALRFAAEIAREAGCPGHRAEILLAEYVLPHPMRMPSEGEAAPTAEVDADRAPWQTPQSQHTPDRRESSKADGNPHGGSNPTSMLQRHTEEFGEPPDGSAEGLAAREIVELIGRDYEVQRFAFIPPRTQQYGGPGKRNQTGAGAHHSGRYVRAVTPRGKVRELAFDATLRAAAPFQRLRKEKLSPADAASGRVIVTKGDLREKVRESRTGTALLFVVDASGSMHAAKRMKAVKGAVLSLLRDAYRQRDSVGMVTFRGGRADLLLDITRSVELAERRLQVLPTGGKTPLALGLRRGSETIHTLMRKKSRLVPAMIVITDGKANVSHLPDGDPWRDSLKVAHYIAEAGIQTLVIDTEQGFVRLGLARKLAEALQGQYCRLDELEAGRIERIVRDML